MVRPYIDLSMVIHMYDVCMGGINHPTGLPEDQVRVYFRQMVQGLLHLKAYGLAHG